VLRAFAAAHPRTPLWWGACDALQTPHPLLPLHDIARDAGVRFGALIEGGGSRAALFDAVLDELRRAAEPMLVVIEDAHWADDATLDLIRFVGRRIERTKALLALSFRDDEVNASHPLRRVIGELPSAAVMRLPLQRLSPAAVTTLALRAGRPPAGLHAATQGNPFFVTELLRQPAEALPPSVQALVLARFARLPGAAQAVARLASIVPARSSAGWSTCCWHQRCPTSRPASTAGCCSPTPRRSRFATNWRGWPSSRRCRLRSRNRCTRKP
jgi:hypothetical protein